MEEEKTMMMAKWGANNLMFVWHDDLWRFDVGKLEITVSRHTVAGCTARYLETAFTRDSSQEALSELHAWLTRHAREVNDALYLGK